MSERYGKCKRCKGAGEIHVKRQCPVLLTEERKTIECGSCGGTGFDGSGSTYHERNVAQDEENMKAYNG